MVRADRVSNLRITVHSENQDSHVSQRLRVHGDWEPYETSLVIDALCSVSEQANYVFVDVGANIGYYSLIAGQQLQGKGQVYAFEPERDNHALLQKNIGDNQLDNVTAVPAALCDQTGAGRIYLNPENKGDHQVYLAEPGRSSYAISMLDGSEYFADEKIARLDFIKIDTQGAEFQVLTGLQTLIRASLPSLKLIVEFWPAGLRRANASGDQLLDLLLSFSLPMNIIDHIGHTLIPCTEKDLRDWIHETDANAENEGFINLLLG